MKSSNNTIYTVAQGCTFCNTCIYECPVGAISMTRKGAVIDQETCIHCGACYDNCASEAIKREIADQAVSE